MPITAYIALGSNLGDRRATLDQALTLLAQTPGVAVTRVSTMRETEPMGGPAGQGMYLNAAAELRTELSAPELLHILLAIEAKLGRVRAERFGPRTLDLDLLLYGQEKIDIPGLVVPHPRMHERLFVLEPLLEIAPFVVHPVFQCTVSDLWRRLQMGKELSGLRAMVTGSTSGIGRAIALELARGGADVLVHGRRSQEAAEDVTRQIVGLGTGSAEIMGDLTETETCRRILDEAWSWRGGLDVWINNAGADTLTGEAARWSFAEKLQRLWAVDVEATMLLARGVGERMRAGGGVIINMGWDQAETGMEGDSGQLFAATKGAIMAFTKSLALSLAPKVRVNCLAPGWIRTAWGEGASAAWQERAVREAPLARWGTPEDVAQTARWLVSPAAAFITGQVIRVNGGAVR